MSQNPYSQSGMQQGGGSVGLETYSGESRTSIMAIASLVLGILSIVGCCVGAIPGVPAAALGIAAILAINAKQGELTGRGLAVGGIVTGTIGLFLSILIWTGASLYVKALGTIITPAMNGVEALDVRAVSQVLSPETAAKLDEPTMRAFRTAYQARLGKFQGTDANLLRYFGIAAEAYAGNELSARLISAQQGAPVPVGGRFENGNAQVWLLAPNKTQSTGKANVFVNIIVVPEEGEPIFLLPIPEGSAPGTAPAPSANPGSSVPPSGEAPKSDPAPPTGG
jgi:Domain of unknown function (DUF4190)